MSIKRGALFKWSSPFTEIQSSNLFICWHLQILNCSLKSFEEIWIPFSLALKRQNIFSLGIEVLRNWFLIDNNTCSDIFSTFTLFPRIVCKPMGLFPGLCPCAYITPISPFWPKGYQKMNTQQSVYDSLFKISTVHCSAIVVSLKKTFDGDKQGTSWPLFLELYNFAVTVTYTEPISVVGWRAEGPSGFSTPRFLAYIHWATTK